MLHNLSQEIFCRHVFVSFPLFIDCNRNNFPIWCSNKQNEALYKHYNTEIYLVVIHMTLSEKTATGKTIFSFSASMLKMIIPL